jgi:hypothetical protein
MVLNHRSSPDATDASDINNQKRSSPINSVITANLSVAITARTWIITLISVLFLPLVYIYFTKAAISFILTLQLLLWGLSLILVSAISLAVLLFELIAIKQNSLKAKVEGNKYLNFAANKVLPRVFNIPEVLDVQHLNHQVKTAEQYVLAILIAFGLMVIALQNYS